MNVSGISAEYEKVDQSLYGSKNINDSLGLLYHENSKMHPFSIREQGLIISGFFNPLLMDRTSQPYKCYPGLKKIAMDQFLDISSPEGLTASLSARRSVRRFEPGYKISLFELFHILHYSYGICYEEPISTGTGHIGFRSVPSAGGLYPLEVYVAVLDGQMNEGLYHFHSRANELELLNTKNLRDELDQIVQAKPFIHLNEASAVIFITSLPERSMIKYGERGYRFIQQEVGALGLSISLLCDDIGLGSCYAGMFIDDEVEGILGIDGVFETIQGIMIIGKKKTNE